MLAGNVFLSAVIGMVAMASTVALSLPTWVTLVTYPVFCSLTLLLVAAIWNIRTSRAVKQKDRRLQGHA
jgi:membrane protein implicated in regulation of membrane protease activity